MRDELFLNTATSTSARSGVQAGLDPAPYDHSLGAVFIDVNGDGRPDLYVANDEDPNRLYVNEPGGPLGFHFVDVARAKHIADANAGMGIADARGLPLRQQLAWPDARGLSAARARRSPMSARPSLAPSAERHRVGRLRGSTYATTARSELVLANGAIPVTNLRKDAGAAAGPDAGRTAGGSTRASCGACA